MENVLTVYQVNSLGKDFFGYASKYPNSYKQYIEGHDILVKRGKQSLLGGGYIAKEDNGEMSAWICCSHFYPDYYESPDKYLFTTEFSESYNNGIFPKYTTDDKTGEMIILRYVDYEAVYRSISKIRDDIRRREFDVDYIEILWTDDGNPDIIRPIVSDIFQGTDIKVRLDFSRLGSTANP